jgi:hypothetical protein
MDLKQKQASVVEARYTRNAAKASAEQAEAATSLGYETVKQGWSIMTFTIVTIIFVRRFVLNSSLFELTCHNAASPIILHWPFWDERELLNFYRV